MVQSRALMGAANWHKKTFRKRFNKENGRKGAIYWWLVSSEQPKCEKDETFNFCLHFLPLS